MEILSVHPAGVPVATRRIAEEFGLVSILDEMLPWDRAQCKFSPGTRLLVLIFAILHDRTALYRVKEFLEGQDLTVLLGQPAVPTDFNDDALGRALDKLWEAGAQRVFTTICARALATCGLSWSRLLALHADTTSVSVYGAYEDEEPGTIAIRHGYSKDRRPDLKQFGIGLICTADGLPWTGTVQHGNLSDKVWNHEVLDLLGKQLSAEELERILYVADSAVVTYENLREIEDLHLRFLARLPESFGLAEELKQAAWAENRWEEIGALSPRKQAARYRVHERTCVLDGRTYRALVVHSTSLDQRKEQALRRRVETERQALEKAIGALEQRTFACADDAREALETFRREQVTDFWAVEGEVVSETVREKRRRRGRPRKDEPVPEHTVYRLRVRLQQREDRVEAWKRLAGTFVLITNAREPSARELLEAYKGQQTAVEYPFRALKGLPVSPVFVKTPHRVEALAWVLLMAYLVYAVMQYRVRQAVARRGRPLITPGNRKDERPTGRSILDMLLIARS